MRHLILLTILLTLPAAADGPPFENAADWRLDFRHHHAGSGEYYMVETMGSGVAIFDVDDDGDPDVLFVDGGPLPGYTDEPPRTRLFRNDRTPDGPRFVDVTEGSGIEVVAYGMGATAGDVDGDGDLDLFISSFGRNQLFENLGDGTFRDVTDRAGTAVGDARFAASAAFGDPDVDGDLDLYVTSYVDFALDHNIVCGAERYGRRSYCHPDVYEGVPDLYLENRGDGTFEDATERTGFGGTAGKGLGVVWSDLDVDGDLDLYVANDITFNLHYENVGWRDDGPPFEDVAILYGTAASDLGTPEASMGLAVGDIGGDLRPEVFVTHFNLETNALYSSQPGGLFIDRRFASGLAEPSVGHLGFGNALLELVELGLDRPPVEFLAPVRDPLLEGLAVGPVAPARPGDLIGKPRGPEPTMQIRDLLVGNVNPESFDRHGQWLPHRPTPSVARRPTLRPFRSGASCRHPRDSFFSGTRRRSRGIPRCRGSEVK